MHKIAVMGDRDSILGYKAIGFDIYPVENEDSSELLRNIVKEGYALIYITEDVAQTIMDEISRYRSDYFPAIILIPGVKGSLGIGMGSIKKNIERAVGADILADDD
jgi:V/A-type H+-transporting ATPase subunit F